MRKQSNQTIKLGKFDGQGNKSFICHYIRLQNLCLELKFSLCGWERVRDIPATIFFWMLLICIVADLAFTCQIYLYIKINNILSN